MQQSDSGLAAGLAVGMLLVVLVALIFVLMTVPVGGGPDARPLIDIRFR